MVERWYGTLVDEFGKKLDEETRNRWNEKLGSEFIHKGGEDMIIRAINWWARSGKTIPKPYEVTLKFLRMVVYTYRKEHDIAHVVEECGICYKGWVDDGTNMAIPCNCSKGRKWLEKCVPPEEHEEMKERAKEAIHRIADENREAKTVAQDMKAKGLKLTQVLSSVMKKDQETLQAQIDSGKIKTKTVGWGYKDSGEIPF